MKVVFPPQAYLYEARQRYEADADVGVPYVCHRNGQHVHSYREAWELSVARAGIKHFPMYHIRHIAVSESLAGGADLAAVAAQAGHSSIATTSGFYAHAIPGAQQRAAALLPELTLPGQVHHRYSIGTVNPKEKDDHE